MKATLVRNLALSLLAASLPATVSALSLGQVDNFEDGTTQGWVVSLLGAVHPSPPVNIPSGGPAGVDDNYLLLTSLGGAGAGSRLVGINNSQWTGNFAAGGFDTIRMDVNNFGGTDVDLRLLFEDPSFGPPSNVAFSSSAIHVPAGSGWQTVEFPILASNLTADLGSVAAALQNTTLLRLYHSTAADFPGSAGLAQLGVDNITAAQAIPEVPVRAVPLAALGAGFLIVSRWRNGRGTK